MAANEIIPIRIVNSQPLGPIGNLIHQGMISDDWILSRSAASCSTGPKIVLRSRDDAGANGILQDIANRIDVVVPIHWEGLKSAVPAVTNEAVFLVYVARVVGMRVLYCLRQRVCTGRNHDVMDMVFHQDILPDNRSVTLAGLTRNSEINQAIRVITEYVGFSIAALHNVVRTSGYDNTLKSQRGDSSQAGREVDTNI